MTEHVTCAGNWYEVRWGRPEELSYDEKVAGKHRREAEEALQIPAPITSYWYPATEGPRLQRLAEPNSFRVQTVDVAADPSKPHIAASTTAGCETTAQAMSSRLHEVRLLRSLQTLARPGT